MKWLYLDSGFCTGRHNMETDIMLAKNCPNDTAYFRTYRWNPFCISLGANQSENDINLEKTAADNIDIVKRPTGGRAILHAEEITYSVIYKLNYDYSPKELYKKISEALIQGLTIYNDYLGSATLEKIQPDFPKLLEEPSGVLCFASTAKNEVKFEGKKLIGSAQRKMDKTILQHGSILCGKFHRKLADYLNVDDSAKKILTDELSEHTTEIESILNSPVDYKKLNQSLKLGFQEYWRINFSDY